MNAGVRSPGRNALISLVLLVASGGALACGILAMTWAGSESMFSVLAIALGALGSIFFLFTLINFVWGMRVFAAIRRGESAYAGDFGRP